MCGFRPERLLWLGTCKHLLHLWHCPRAVHQLADLGVGQLVGCDKRQQRDGLARARGHLQAAACRNTGQVSGFQYYTSVHAALAAKENTAREECSAHLEQAVALGIQGVLELQHVLELLRIYEFIGEENLKPFELESHYSKSYEEVELLIASRMRQ